MAPLRGEIIETFGTLLGPTIRFPTDAIVVLKPSVTRREIVPLALAGSSSVCMTTCDPAEIEPDSGMIVAPPSCVYSTNTVRLSSSRSDVVHCTVVVMPRVAPGAGLVIDTLGALVLRVITSVTTPFQINSSVSALFRSGYSVTDHVTAGAGPPIANDVGVIIPVVELTRFAVDEAPAGFAL